MKVTGAIENHVFQIWIIFAVLKMESLKIFYGEWACRI